MQDVVSNAQLADVMHGRSHTQQFYLGFAHAVPLTQESGVFSNPTDMVPCFFGTCFRRFHEQKEHFLASKVHLVVQVEVFKSSGNV